MLARNAPRLVLAFGIVYGTLLAWWGGMQTLLDHGSRAATVGVAFALPAFVTLVAWNLHAARKEER